MGDEVRQGNGRFEPPPWEREAFEALARKRAEEQAALAALVATPAVAAPVLQPEPEAEVTPLVADPEAEAAPKPPVKPADKTEAQLIDERRVQAMLMELSREETADTGSIKLIARIASVVTGVVGIGMLFGGVMAIQRAGGTTAGVMGSGALSVFGLCFVAMAVWVWVGSNRSRRSR